MDGPDQILPATSFKTCEPDGTVELVITPSTKHKKPISVYTLFKSIAEQFPNSPALMAKRDNVWKQWTYKEYFEETVIVAKAFIKLGLERFHGVCIMGYNTPEWVISGYGCIFAGGLSAGVYTTNSPEACQILADSCRAQIIVVEDEECLNRFLAVKRFLPEIKAIVQWAGEPKIPGVISWAELLAIGSFESDQELKSRLSLTAVNQCCSLIYTSGTTGPPKGVMLSQDQVTWGASFYQEKYNVPFHSSSVSFLPLSHLAAQMGDMFLLLRVAGVIWFSQPDALKGSLGKTLAEVQPSIFFSVPRVWEKMYEKIQEVAAQSGYFKKSVGAWARYHSANYYDALKEGRQLSILEQAKYSSAKSLVLNRIKEVIGFRNSQFIASGAAPVEPVILNFFLGLDMPILELYGLSESLSIATCSLLEKNGWKHGSVGKIPEETELILMGIGDHMDGEGEICIRGRNVCMGYLRMPDKTDETIDDDGWLHTGDLGRIDSEGFVFISGRLKELIITAGGENIPPVLIEEAVKRELPCVANAMLLGDKRKFLSILLTLKADVDEETQMPLQSLTPVCQEWVRQVGATAESVEQVRREVDSHPNGPIATAIQDGFDRYNKLHALSHAQRVQRWTILPHDFSLPTGELNNTLKIKRTSVLDKYADLIENLYSRPANKSKL